MFSAHQLVFIVPKAMMFWRLWNLEKAGLTGRNGVFAGFYELRLANVTLHPDC